MTSANNNMIDRDKLVDIQSIVIDTAKPVNERIMDYKRQIGDQNCFLYEDTVVHISFMDSGPSMRDRIEQYLLSGQCADLTSA